MVDLLFFYLQGVRKIMPDEKVEKFFSWVMVSSCVLLERGRYINPFFGLPRFYRIY